MLTTGQSRNRFLELLLPQGHLCPQASAIVDYKYYVINNLLRAFGLIPLLIGVPVVANLDRGIAGAPYWVRVSQGVNRPARSRGCFFTLAVMARLRLWAIFVAHYLQHRVPVFWEFHKVHHSAQVLTPITLYRMHPIDDMLTAVSAPRRPSAWSCGRFYVGISAAR